MIPETEHPQVKCVYPGKPVWHAQADPGRYFTPSPQSWFVLKTAQIKGRSTEHAGSRMFYLKMLKLRHNICLYDIETYRDKFEYVSGPVKTLEAALLA